MLPVGRDGLWLIDNILIIGSANGNKEEKSADVDVECQEEMCKNTFKEKN